MRIILNQINFFYFETKANKYCYTYLVAFSDVSSVKKKNRNKETIKVACIVVYIYVLALKTVLS